MLRKLVNISLIALMFSMSEVIAYAGTTGSEELKKSNTSETASECFEGLSRTIFKFNMFWKFKNSFIIYFQYICHQNPPA